MYIHWLFQQSIVFLAKKWFSLHFQTISNIMNNSVLGVSVSFLIFAVFCCIFKERVQLNAFLL